MALDPLKDDSLALANKLEEHGNEYYLSIWPGVAHGALSLIPVTPQIQEYVYFYSSVKVAMSPVVNCA